MKKILLCLLVFAFLACASDDENPPAIHINGISFNLNGVEYVLTDYSVLLQTTNTVDRVVEASFDNNSKTLLFSVLEEETNQIDEFTFIDNGIHYSSDPIYGDRETSITVHTDSKMEGTFRATLTDTNDRPLFTFTNGVIDIEY